MPQTVCLNMIVKNEVHVIERCLASVRELIDYWVIVDTGSVDGTPEVIAAALAGTPGELHHREWKDFGTNRTEALELARGKSDYVFIIDADEQLPGTGRLRLAAPGQGRPRPAALTRIVQCVLLLEAQPDP